LAVGAIFIFSSMLKEKCGLLTNFIITFGKAPTEEIIHLAANSMLLEYYWG
jgi:hypothetical protein